MLDCPSNMSQTSYWSKRLVASHDQILTLKRRFAPTELRSISLHSHFRPQNWSIRLRVHISRWHHEDDVFLNSINTEKSQFLPPSSHLLSLSPPRSNSCIQDSLFLALPVGEKEEECVWRVQLQEVHSRDLAEPPQTHVGGLLQRFVAHQRRVLNLTKPYPGLGVSLYIYPWIASTCIQLSLLSSCIRASNTSLLLFDIHGGGEVSAAYVWRGKSSVCSIFI